MFKNILVPTDGSAQSQDAAQQAIELARAIGGKLVGLHVHHKFLGGPYGTFGPARDVLEEAHKQHAEATAERILAQIKKQADAAGVSFEPVVAENNEVWKQIIATAKKKKCDVICMASHGRRGLSAVVLGSETVKVLTHSKVPVLVLR